MAYTVLVNLDLSIELQLRIKRLILENELLEEKITENYPYFTSKDRNFYAGSSVLTSAWFLEATKDW
jgi:hypothetical protein